MTTRQVLQAVYTSNANLTTLLPLDDTVPLSTEGTEVLSQAITLASSANKVLVEVALWGRGNPASFVWWGAALFRGTTCLNVRGHVIDTFDVGTTVAMDLLDQPGAVGPHTYSVRVGPDAGTLRLNGIESARRFGGISKCTLTLREIA